MKQCVTVGQNWNLIQFEVVGPPVFLCYNSFTCHFKVFHECDSVPGKGDEKSLRHNVAHTIGSRQTSLCNVDGASPLRIVLYFSVVWCLSIDRYFHNTFHKNKFQFPGLEL